MPITQDQADALLQAGRITQGSYDSLGFSGPPPPAPVAAPPPDNSHASPPVGGPPAFDIRSQPSNLGGFVPPAPPTQAPQASGPVDPLQALADADRKAHPGSFDKYEGAPTYSAGFGLNGGQRTIGVPVPPQGHVEVGPITTVKPPVGASSTGGMAGPFTPRSSGMADYTKAENRGLEGQAKTLGHIQDLAGQRAVEEGDLRDQQRNEAEQQRVLDLASKKNEDDHRDSLFTDRMAAVDKYRAAAIDPDQLSKQRGPLGNLVAALAIGAGAFGAAKIGGPNTAMQLIKDQTEQNIRAQEANLAKTRDEVGISDNAIAQYRQMTGDNEAARAGVRADLLTRQRDALQGLASKYGNQVDQAKLGQSISDLNTEIQKNDAILKSKIEANSAQQAAATAAQARAQQGKIADFTKDFILKGDDPIEAARKANMAVTGRIYGDGPMTAIPDKEHQQDLSKRTVLVDRKPVVVTNEQTAKDYKEWQDAAPDVHDSLRRGKKAWADGDVAGYESARAQFLDAAPKFYLGSSASGPTKGQLQETYTHMFPEYRHWYHPADALTQDRTDTALDALTKSVEHRDKTIHESTFQGAGPSTVGFKAGQ